MLFRGDETLIPPDPRGGPLLGELLAVGLLLGVAGARSSGWLGLVVGFSFVLLGSCLLALGCVSQGVVTPWVADCRQLAWAGYLGGYGGWRSLGPALKIDGEGPKDLGDSVSRARPEACGG
jgi:hypothetical protein